MRISERGQITIPKQLRDRFGMNPDVEVEITPTEQGLLIQKRTAARHPVERVYAILGRGEAPTTTLKRSGEDDYRRRYERPIGRAGKYKRGGWLNANRRVCSYQSRTRRQRRPRAAACQPKYYNCLKAIAGMTTTAVSTE